MLRPDAAPAVLSVATSLPAHRYGQPDLVRLAKRLFPKLGEDEHALEAFFERVGVKERRLALPEVAYEHLGGLATRTHAWLEIGLSLAESAVQRALDEAGLQPDEISMMMSTTVTGVAAPTLDTRLMNRMHFAPTLKRVPMFGLGCVGGAAGLARVADYLRAFPDEAAILLSVELCSLTLHKDDASVPNLVSTALFGDGVAAVVVVGPEHRLAHKARPELVDSRSVFIPNTEQVMGWKVVDTGFQLVLNKEVSDLARETIPPAVDAFLDEHHLSRADIGTWVTHPTGPGVLEALKDGLQLRREDLQPSLDSLAEIGNLSSASVLFLLDEYRRFMAPSRGTPGLLMAIGPAFCAELVLLRWP